MVTVSRPVPAAGWTRLMRRGCLIGVTLLATGAAAWGQPPSASPTIATQLDVPYAGTDNPRQTLDLFVPKTSQTDGPVPLVVYIHGGGWQGGDKAQNRKQMTDLARTGRYAAASVGYRLTDQASWPAQAHDVKAAIRFLRAKASDFGYDPDRIGVMGASAGGHLVAILGTTGDEADLNGTLGDHPDVSNRVSCVVNLFGPTDMPRMVRPAAEGGSNGAGGMIDKLLGGPVAQRSAEAASASPVTHVTADDAPVLTIHGTDDRLVPPSQATVFHDALDKAGVTNHLLLVEGGGHGPGFPPETIARTFTFLEHHLHGAKATLPTRETVPAVKPPTR